MPELQRKCKIEKLNICMLIQHFRIGKLGGEENAVLNFAKALKNVGVTPSIIVQDGVGNYQLFNGIDFYGGLRYSYGLSSLIKRIELNRSLHFSLIHSHEVNRAFLHSIFKFNLPFAVHYHNPMSSTPRAIGRFTMTLKKADRVFVPSKFVARKLSNYTGVSEEKINVIYNGVDIELFQHRMNTDLLQSYGIPDDIDVIEFVGRCSPIKGILTLVKAIPEVVKQARNAKFVFVGVRPLPGSPRNSYYDKLLSEVSRLDIADSCFFVPYVKQSDLPYFYSRASITVAPSLLEAFPLTVLESLSCGTPVIASRAGGLPEAVDEQVGMLFPTENDRCLANCIVQLLEDSNSRKKMGAAGRKRVEEHFTWDSSAEKLKQIYLELINSKGKN